MLPVWGACNWKGLFSEFYGSRALRALFFFLPSLPTTPRGLCGRESYTAHVVSLQCRGNSILPMTSSTSADCVVKVAGYEPGNPQEK